MDIKDLYTLIAIADRGSFAEAGTSLGLSLSAVSTQMRSLEESLSTKLFDRSRRPPVLTEAGLDFTNRARELIVHWESMSEALRKDVIASYRVDPEILGGVVVRVGDRVFDGSVRRRVTKLRRLLLSR